VRRASAAQSAGLTSIDVCSIGADAIVDRLRSLGARDLSYVRYENCSSAHTPTDSSDGLEDMLGHDAWTKTYASPYFVTWLNA